MRSATLLAAHVCRFRLDRGMWPPRLTDAAPQDTSTTTIDPYTGVEFGYRIVNEKPILYSLNEDGVDDGAIPGEWGRPGTDVVLFSVGNPQG